MSAPIPQNCTWVGGVSPADTPSPDDRLTTARARLAELLEKHPEMAAYTRPASAGDIAELGKKLDEIAGLLRRPAGSEPPRNAEVAPFPAPGQVEMEHIPDLLTTIRATLQPGMSLTLPPVPVASILDAVRSARLDDLLDALELAAQRPDVIAVMREREVAGENHVRKVFGELPVAPGDGPLTCLTLKAGAPQ